MLKTISYTSTAKDNLSLLNIECLFQETQQRNNSRQITGVLAKKDKTFFQIIEGESHIVDDLYAKIKKDSRHFNIRELLNEPIKQLSFNNFETGYSIVQDLNALYQLQNYMEKLESCKHENCTLFLQFIEDLLEVEQ